MTNKKEAITIKDNEDMIIRGLESTIYSDNTAIVESGVLRLYTPQLPIPLKYHSESGMDIFYGSKGSAGLDLPFADPELEEITIMPGEKAKLYTGISCEIPEGYYGEIDTRSSTSKRDLVLLCRTIDWDYRGVLRVVVINAGNRPQTIKKGEYIAQMVIKPYLRVNPIKVESKEEFSPTERGANGFGSTGNTNVR